LAATIRLTGLIRSRLRREAFNGFGRAAAAAPVRVVVAAVVAAVIRRRPQVAVRAAVAVAMPQQLVGPERGVDAVVVAAVEVGIP
jgi:hypothetical protein